MDQFSSNKRHKCAKVLVKVIYENQPTESTVPRESVYAYATDLLPICLQWHGFHDAIIMTYWKFLMAVKNRNIQMKD